MIDVEFLNATNYGQDPGDVDYEKTVPVDEAPPLPTSCPTLAQMTPVFNSWSDDFNRPDSANFGPNWTSWIDPCTGANNNQWAGIQLNQCRMVILPQQNTGSGGCGTADDTSINPHFSYFNAIPFTVKDQIVQATFKSTVYHACTFDPGSVSDAQFGIAVRVLVNPNAVNTFVSNPGLTNQNGIIGYIGYYSERYNAAGVFVSATVRITRYDQAGASVLNAVNVSRFVAGDVLKLTAANFLSGGVEGVCLRLYVNDVLRTQANDFTNPTGTPGQQPWATNGTHGKILTGSMGICCDKQSNVQFSECFFDDWQAFQTGPNPT